MNVYNSKMQRQIRSLKQDMTSRADKYSCIQVTRLCRCRHFYSKGAFLVLLWVFLIQVTTWTFGANLSNVSWPDNDWVKYSRIFVLVLVVLLFVVIPLTGWLADTRWGNYKLFKAGCVIYFMVTVTVCISVLLTENDVWRTVSAVIENLCYPIGLLGLIATSGQALHLGLDQMPEASSDNITSFIAWLVFSLFLGFWTSDFLYYVLENCSTAGDVLSISQKIQIFSFLPVVCMAIVCCTIFLFAPKWLIIEPKAPQSLKTIYRVLKFAAKHKAPLNRSAFTYWEEDVPSRLDLGKSKYGGPFTTEQVEDVKTFYKVLIMHIPTFITLPTSIVATTARVIGMQNIPGFTECSSVLTYTFGYSPWWIMLLATIVFELTIYPLVRNKLPSMLKRIGLASLSVLTTNIVYLVLNILHQTETATLAYTIAYYVVFSLNMLFLITPLFEFVCAQSPYNMRGLLTGYTMFGLAIALSIGTVIYKGIIGEFVQRKHKDIAAFSIATILSLIGFLLHCVLAWWYKRRVRDEDYSVHTVVEEVYDRYLEQAARNRY